MAFRCRASLSFPSPTLALDRASEAGFEATHDMIAKIGRARCLGERSRGTPDAGVASCRLLMNTLSAAAFLEMRRREAGSLMP